MPAASTNPVDVCNLALQYVGSSQELNTLDEARAEARACKRFYSRVRDACLERFIWRFATVRADLALLANAARSGWTYTYQLPANCITPQFIVPPGFSGELLSSEEEKIPFDVEADQVLGVVTSKVLLSNLENAELVYTAECPNVALWSPLFVDLVAWEIAVKLCLTLPVKPDWAIRAKQGARDAFAEAGASQLRARKQGTLPRSSFTTAR